MQERPQGADDELSATMAEVEQAAGAAPEPPPPPAAPAPGPPHGAGPPTYGAPQAGYPQPQPPPVYGAPQAGYPQPQPAYGMPQPGQVMVTIGDIGVTPTEVITPLGRRPVRGTVWMIQNNTVATQSIPTYAIVLAVVFAIFCLLGLLFLLIKEDKTQGYVVVSVQADGFFHATQVPVSYPTQIAEIDGRVNYARALAASA